MIALLALICLPVVAAVILADWAADAAEALVRDDVDGAGQPGSELPSRPERGGPRA